MKVIIKKYINLNIKNNFYNTIFLGANSEKNHIIFNVN